MPIPINAVPFEQPLDPGDVLDFRAAFSRGPADTKPPPILLPNEDIASMTLELTSEAIALGLKIVSGQFNGAEYPAPSIDDDNVLTFWLGVDPSFQSATAFLNSGTLLGVDVTIRTSNVPPRIKNRTLVVRVRQIAGEGDQL